MDDPWDVKSVRQAGQYTSCMKLNGAPLLPPVLSRECRKEMQYYKLLAKEVEKRISNLQTYVSDNDIESMDDKTDAPEISDSEQTNGVQELVEAAFDLSIDKLAVSKQKNIETELPTSDYDKTLNVTSDVSKLVIDFSLSINQTGRNVLETVKRKSPCRVIELPERDYNCIKNKELILDLNTCHQKEEKKEKSIEDFVNFTISVKDELSDPFSESVTSKGGPPSVNSKSFTGSLNDLHTESVRGETPTVLARQRSYTVLNPSPQLLAHLEVQSLNTGVEMSLISMSESLSNLSLPNKKRRSWDLESAKVKWSSMAMELKGKKLPSTTNTATKNTVKNTAKTVQAIYSPPRAKSVAIERNRRGSTPTKFTPKSETHQKRRPSPIRNIPSTSTIVKGPKSPPRSTQKKSLPPKSPPIPKSPPPKSPPSPKSPTSPPLKPVVSEAEDPASKVRELYEKIQKQQLVQMASLVEKQKREQMLLQQVFEEQNSLLFKQLKTIVPKTSVEAKEAWGEVALEGDRGPVSLSQLINHKMPEQSNPITSTLTDTNKYIDKCDDVLKKSRDLSGSIHKPRSTSQNTKLHSQRAQLEGSITRTHSPVPSKRTPSPLPRSTSRKLNYDSTTSFDPILTDRTNDTMADLNVTFPTDNSDCESYQNTSYNPKKEMTVNNGTSSPHKPVVCMSTDSAINCMERTIQNSINSCRRPRPNTCYQPPTQRELAAAATIVAYAKGFLVRRLMRTERVMATVQTIRDALLCALQLHQDREGIQGADVDLHRRLIQQITAACYSLHDTFVGSSAAERCALLAADRARRRSLASRPPALLKSARNTDLMSQSHSGVFPARPKRHSASLMTQSTYETYSSDKARRARYMPSPRRRPWR